MSRHSVDRSSRMFQSSTHNVARVSCFEVLSAFVESRKLFLDGSLCLAGRWTWSRCMRSTSWKQRSALLATSLRMSFRTILNMDVIYQILHVLSNNRQLIKKMQYVSP